MGPVEESANKFAATLWGVKRLAVGWVDTVYFVAALPNVGRFDVQGFLRKRS
jgi:hypothetical protein